MPKQYRITATETATVNYYVLAENEDDARELLFQGEFQDYDTVGSDLQDIIDIKEL
jgi:hypothetical protein